MMRIRSGARNDNRRRFVDDREELRNYESQILGGECIIIASTGASQNLIKNRPTTRFRRHKLCHILFSIPMA